MKRIKWVNIIEILILITTTIIILHDLYRTMIQGYSFTWFGILTFIFAIIEGAIICEDLEQKIKIALKN